MGFSRCGFDKIWAKGGMDLGRGGLMEREFRVDLCWHGLSQVLAN